MADDCFERVSLRDADGATLEYLRYGAHALSWRAAGDARERLYLSPRSAWTDGAAVRGGVPVIFPQFAASGPLPRHGFARTRCWQESMRTERSATLRLQPDAQLLAIWPQTFTAELGLAIDGAGLEITLAVRNDGKTPLQFTAALHTYLAVDALDELRIDGLGGRRYRDSADRGVERVQQAAELAIGGEVDRIYFGAGDGAVRVEEPARACRITQTGFSDVVVWNPGPVKGAALADMPPDGWQRMVCVEAAAVERPVELAPGAMWIGTQALRATR